MESGKQANSGGDQQEKTSDDEARTGGGGGGRSYDCNFCKRGFTNAQALGGHMNIHRKDKADKVKRNSKEPSSSSSSPCPSLRLMSTTHDVQTNNYQVYLSPSPTYYYQHGYNSHFDYHQGNRVIEDYYHPFDDEGLNLSLNFGTPSHDDQFRERRIQIEDDNELDLELRLGNHHC